MEMDKTLKILLACLGVVGIAVLAIPNGDPLTNSDQAPLPPASPSSGQPSDGAPPATPGQVDEAPKYIQPSSDQNPTGSADSATLQQETFGQPMFDPRPISEQVARPEGNQASSQPEQAQPQYVPQPQNPGGANYYSPPPSANGSDYAGQNDQ
jgi:hypothetical protein